MTRPPAHKIERAAIAAGGLGGAPIAGGAACGLGAVPMLPGCRRPRRAVLPRVRQVRGGGGWWPAMISRAVH